MNERILAIITAKGIRRTEFAQKLNISQAYTSQYRLGVNTGNCQKRIPPIKDVIISAGGREK